MFKNGLFLISIGLIVAVVSVDARKGTYDWLSLTSAAVLILSGLGIITYDKRKQAKLTKK